jgi:hypothetical protein
MMIAFFNYLRQRHHRVDNGIFFPKQSFNNFKREKTLCCQWNSLLTAKKYIFFFFEKNINHILKFELQANSKEDFAKFSQFKKKKKKLIIHS